MIKSIIRHLIYGVAGGCALFVVSIIFWDLTGDVRLQEFFDNFTIYALTYIAVGIGFSVSGMVYDTDRLALWLKILINMFVGFGIFLLVGSNVGIISFESPARIVLYVVVAVIILIVACSTDYLLSKREAKAINKKLEEGDSDVK